MNQARLAVYKKLQLSRACESFTRHKDVAALGSLCRDSRLDFGFWQLLWPPGQGTLASGDWSCRARFLDVKCLSGVEGLVLPFSLAFPRNVREVRTVAAVSAFM